ncbi:MAG: sodium:solute symporter family protein [bacterium]
MLKIIIVTIYILVMLFIGYSCRRRSKTLDDFFLGGRNVGPWLSAFAYGSTYFSAVLFIGYAGKIGWGFGLHALWIVLGNALVGVYLAWKVLGPRTRVMSARLNAMTMPEFLEARYDSQAMKLISASLIFIFLVPYTASVYMGLSYLFEVNLGIDYNLALAFMAVLTSVYLIMGGYVALMITDLIQGMIMIGGVAVMIFSLTGQVGGIRHATTELMKAEYAPALQTTGGIPGWLTLLSLVIVTSLGPWGLPQMVQKFYSIKSETQINRAAIACTILALILAFGAYFTGAMTHLFYPQLPSPNIDELIPRLLTDFTPQAITLVILLLVISASMSSLSSLVLVSSSAITIDFYKGFIQPDADHRKVVLLMRLFCGIFILFSLWIALQQPSVIVNLMVISWGALAGSFMGPYLYGLYWKRTTKAAAFAGMGTGLLTSITMYWYLGAPGIPLGGAVSILLPLLVIPVVSLVTQPYSQTRLEQVFCRESPAPAITQQPEA